jgi:hypothetical protein
MKSSLEKTLNKLDSMDNLKWQKNTKEQS